MSPFTTSSTTSLSTTASTVSSGSSHTTDYSSPDGNTRLCQGIHLQHASDNSNNIGQYGEYCYEILSHYKMSWQHAEDLCQSGHGHLVSITSAPEQAFVQGFMQRHMSSHAIWIGLHDTKTENVFEWTSGNTVSYTNWISGHLNNFQSHYQEDCVALIPYQGGTWDDIPCGIDGILGTDFGETHYAMCKFDAQTTLQSTAPPSLTTVSIHNLDGNTNLCTNQNKQHAIANGNVLAQYGSHCFELMSHVKVSWLHGESLCQSSQGHLLQIKSAAEQTFIGGFMQRHMPDHAVWIGLHDRNSESYFEWTTGERVSYTNWLPGHTNNFLFHEDEDCVVLVPYKGGQWDDIPCGGAGMFLQDRGETHPVICQYDTASGPSLIG